MRRPLIQGAWALRCKRLSELAARCDTEMRPYWLRHAAFGACTINSSTADREDSTRKEAFIPIYTSVVAETIRAHGQCLQLVPLSQTVL